VTPRGAKGRGRDRERRKQKRARQKNIMYAVRVPILARHTGARDAHCLRCWRRSCCCSAKRPKFSTCRSRSRPPIPSIPSRLIMPASWPQRRFSQMCRERVCCLLVLNSVTSTPQWIRQPWAAWTLLRAYDVSPTTAQARTSAPKRAPTTATLPISRRRSARIAAS
jgi:hypothetical protein